MTCIGCDYEALGAMLGVPLGAITCRVHKDSPGNQAEKSAVQIEQETRSRFGRKENHDNP